MTTRHLLGHGKQRRTIAEQPHRTSVQRGIDYQGQAQRTASICFTSGT
jgi:hypothetical protein